MIARIKTKPRGGVRREPALTKRSRLEVAEFSPVWQELVDTPITFIDNPEFENSLEQREIEADDVLGEVERLLSESAYLELPRETPAYLAVLYRTPLLTASLERRLFRKMNFLKWQVREQVERFARREPKSTTVNRVVAMREQAITLRNRIVSANLRLVVSIARKFVGKGVLVSDLISDGNLILMHAVEKFDFARGYRFSTYATLAIQRELVRRIRRGILDKSRLPMDVEECAGRVSDSRDEQLEPGYAVQSRRREILRKLIDEHLDEREQQIILARFGLDDLDGPRGLRTVGAELGISKERVRQLQLRAMATLRRFADAAGLNDGEPAQLDASVAGDSAELSP